MEEFIYQQALPVTLLILGIIWLALRYQKKDKQLETLSLECVKLATLFQEVVSKKSDEHKETIERLQEIKEALHEISRSNTKN